MSSLLQLDATAPVCVALSMFLHLIREFVLCLLTAANVLAACTRVTQTPHYSSTVNRSSLYTVQTLLLGEKPPFTRFLFTVVDLTTFYCPAGVDSVRRGWLSRVDVITSAADGAHDMLLICLPIVRPAL